MTDETKPYLAQCEGQAPVAWLVPSDETGFCRIWWRDKESADAWIAKHPHCTLVPLYTSPTPGQPAAVAEVRSALDRCRNVLWNMALEYEGAIFRRWPINHEPLRNDARGLIPVIDSAFVALAALTRSVEATDATINNPLTDSRVGVEAGWQPVGFGVFWNEGGQACSVLKTSEADALNFAAYLGVTGSIEQVFRCIPSTPGVGK